MHLNQDNAARAGQGGGPALNRRSFLRATSLGIGVAAFGGLLVACGSDPVDGTAATGTPVVGGSITYLEGLRFSNLYPPSSAANQDSIFLNQLLDRLVWQDPKTLELQPWLATSWEYDDSQTALTMRLREDVTFSDGTPLTAAAVVQVLDFYGKGDTERGLVASESLRGYDSAEATGEHELVIRLSEPVRSFVQGLSAVNSGIISPATIDLDAFGVGNLTRIVGSGPFVVAEEEPGQSVTVTAREDYAWAPASWPNQGRPYLDEVQWVVTPESSVRIGALLSGQADAIRNVEPQEEERVNSSPGVSVLTPIPWGTVNLIHLRVGATLLRDANVRRALVRGTDVPELHTALMTPSFVPAQDLFETSTGISRDLRSKFAYDPQLAAQLLDEAGWTMGPDGFRYKDGAKLSLTAAETGPVARSLDMFNMLANQWAEIGVELNVLPASAPDFAERTADPNSIQIRQSSAQRADPDVLAALYAVANGRNQLQNRDPETREIVDPQLEQVLADIVAAPTLDEAIEKAQIAQEYILDQAYAVPLWDVPLVQGTSDRLQGWTFEAIARPIFQNLWIGD